MRLTFALSVSAVATVLLVPLATSAQASDSTRLRVTAVVQDAHGHLSFQSEHVTGRWAAHARAARLRARTGVVAADVDQVVHVAGTPDPLQPQQWALTTLSADSAWASSDASGQVVAVIDTGVDATHPDLAGVVLPGTDFIAPGDGRTDPNGHGTHVAGIIGAVGGNGIGGAGLAQGAAILPVRVMDATGSGYDGDAARGLVWAADHGATVANLSFGGPDRSSVLDSAISYALGKGVSVVAAAGNSGLDGDPVLWPAADPGVIAVGAVDQAGVRPGWSSTGSHLAVAAPGVAILSTVPGGGYEAWSGTSMAAPFVSAAAALLKHRSVLTPAAVRTRLMSTADDLGPAGFDPEYGAGRIDLLTAEGISALAPVVTDPIVVSPSPSPSPSASPAPTASPLPPEPVISPTPTPAPTEVAIPVLSARISVSSTRTSYGQAVTVATRTLADGVPTGGVPVELDRLVGTSWVLTRTGTTGPDGLIGWVIRPDRTADYRIVGGGWTPPTARITVVPLLSMSRYLAGRVLPGTATTVRLQVRRVTGWVTVGSTTSRTDGTFHFGTAVPYGAVVRAVALGVASPAVRH